MILMVRIKNIGKPKRIQVQEECETTRDYYYAVLEARQAGEEWAKDIPIDMNILWAETGRFDLISKNEEIYHSKIRKGAEDDDNLPF